MNRSNAGRAWSRAFASDSATWMCTEKPYVGCCTWPFIRPESAWCLAYSVRYCWIIAAVCSKFADRATENAVLNPCAATHGIDPTFEVGYHIGGDGRCPPRRRRSTGGEGKEVPRGSTSPP